MSVALCKNCRDVVEIPVAEDQELTIDFGGEMGQMNLDRKRMFFAHLGFFITPMRAEER